MKRIGILILIAIGLMACSPKENIHEKAIADYVQTDSRGTWTDLQFRVVELSQPTEITVADSIKIINAEFEAVRQASVGQQQHNRAFWQDNMPDDPASATAVRYRKNIEVIDRRIDSLKRLVPQDIVRYDNLPPNEVLVIMVQCRYGVTLPGSGAKKERTETFVLSPDGRKVLGKAKNAD